MDNTIQKIQIYYELAMSIGNSLDLKVMLKQALIKYLRKLNCLSAIVFQLKPKDKDVFETEMVFSIPMEVQVRNNYSNILEHFPEKFSETELNEFRKKLTFVESIQNGTYCHFMQLGKFGFLLLIKNGSRLSDDVLFSIKEINSKLGMACMACLNNAELAKAKVKAEESEKLKMAFMANVSHEIRTPLNGILGFSDLLQVPGIGTENNIKYAKKISENSNKLLEIINDILDMSKIESGTVELKTQEIGIVNFLESLYKEYSVKVLERPDLEFKLNIDKSDQKIISDRHMLYRIFDCLLNNAIKFTNRGQVELGYLLNDHSVEFYVSDSGIGIRDDLLQAVFEPFRQVDLGLSRKYNGTGLGLSISKRFTEILGGQMRIVSEEGKGTKVSVSLPLKEKF